MDHVFEYVRVTTSGRSSSTNACADHPAPADYAVRFPGRADVQDQLATRCFDDGRYVKIRLQGQGGMGLVWLAYDRPRPESDFPMRSRLRFYGFKEPELTSADAASVYAQLSSAPFATASSIAREFRRKRKG